MIRIKIKNAGGIQGVMSSFWKKGFIRGWEGRHVLEKSKNNWPFNYQRDYWRQNKGTIKINDDLGQGLLVIIKNTYV